jgi:gamma-glutamyltranspeptidase/glutathione hydrolase
VRLARDGFEVPEGLARSLSGALTKLGRYPASLQAYSKGGVAYATGETFRQPDLARTLDRIREARSGRLLSRRDGLPAGRRDAPGGGWITEEDLARYQAKERATVQATYRGYDVIGMPPPSSGGVALIEMLNVLEGYDLKALGHNSPAHLHLLAEAMRRAFRDRARFLADPDFAQVPLERLTDKDYAARLRQSIDRERAGRSDPADLQLAEEGLETTHFSVVDASGMAVSVTYTLEQGYGVGIVVPGAGFLLNNEMGDFNAKPGLTTATG